MNQNRPGPVATARGNMYSTIMYELHTVSILVDVINPMKYSVYHPAVGGVRWDAKAMKCYCLPLSPFLLALFPLFCSWSGTEVSAVLLIPGLDELGTQAWICLNHPLPLPVPRRANNLPWADADDGKQHSRGVQKEEGVLDGDVIIGLRDIWAVDREDKRRCLKAPHRERTHMLTIQSWQLLHSFFFAFF